MQALWECRANTRGPNLLLSFTWKCQEKNCKCKQQKISAVQSVYCEPEPWGISSSGNTSPAGPVTLLNLLLCGEHEERSWTKVRNGSFCVRAAVLWADVWVMSDWMGTTGEQVNIRWTLPLCCIYSVSHLTVRPCDQSDCMGVCVCLYVCVCVCVCGIPYVTKCPCKYSNTSTFCPCGDIFRSPWGNKLTIHTELSFLKI